MNCVLKNRERNPTSCHTEANDADRKSFKRQRRLTNVVSASFASECLPGKGFSWKTFSRESKHVIKLVSITKPKKYFKAPVVTIFKMFTPDSVLTMLYHMNKSSPFFHITALCFSLWVGYIKVILDQN